MLTVHIKDLHFFAYHGIFEGESSTGADFEVQLSVQYDETHISFNNLNNIVDYVDLYAIVKKRMAMPTHLLEELAESIIRKIRHEYSFVLAVSISIFKLQPPIEGFRGKVGVELHKKFEA